jgi:hypothetical protein
VTKETPQRRIEYTYGYQGDLSQESGQIYESYEMLGLDGAISKTRKNSTVLSYSCWNFVQTARTLVGETLETSLIKTAGLTSSTRTGNDRVKNVASLASYWDSRGGLFKSDSSFSPSAGDIFFLGSSGMKWSPLFAGIVECVEGEIVTGISRHALTADSPGLVTRSRYAKFAISPFSKNGIIGYARPDHKGIYMPTSEAVLSGNLTEEEIYWASYGKLLLQTGFLSGPIALRKTPDYIDASKKVCKEFGFPFSRLDSNTVAWVSLLLGGASEDIPTERPSLSILDASKQALSKIQREKIYTTHIYYGARSCKSVKELQRALNATGTVPPVEVTGHYFDNTRKSFDQYLENFSGDRLQAFKELFPTTKYKLV